MTASPARKARRAAGRRKAIVSAGGPVGPVKSARRSLPPALSPCDRYLWRRFISDLTAVQSPYWYGQDPRWRLAVEAQARAVFGRALTVTELPGRQLVYRIAIDVHGPAQLTDVTIVFADEPAWDCYGLAPCDYPRVFAEYGAPSKHRMPGDGALCLYYPDDPRERRWTADKGLLDLLDLVVDHLLAEQYWRATGGHNGGIWMFDEAEHGFEQDAA